MNASKEPLGLIFSAVFKWSPKALAPWTTPMMISCFLARLDRNKIAKLTSAKIDLSKIVEKAYGT